MLSKSLISTMKLAQFLKNNSSSNTKSMEEIESPVFNKGVKGMPEYFTDWAWKGRNFKIWDQSLNGHLEAVNISANSQTYFYFSTLTHKVDLLLSNNNFTYPFIWAGKTREDFATARETVANFYYSFEHLYSANIGSWSGCPHCQQEEAIAEGVGEGEGEGGNGGGG